ncbi:uncharacterized protein EV154DRAFT_579439 [Mucor mucedo]|uniref:uncharacterized protein n=1 Tax=Mucor mucedo TaxID=29922 RepID=UPI002220279F|nr:uncharacterized protein EV154DRAFT_579439 [Mucor mucedo]KAI7873261.1 hypothetical protein EV154DRAFT_579439 [Mucor mucedo]
MNPSNPSYQARDMQEQIESLKEMVDSLKTTINTLTETISKIPQVVTMTVSVALSNGNREAMSTKRATITGSNIVHEQENDERRFRECIARAIRYYDAQDRAHGIHGNWNSLGERTIPVVKPYLVSAVKEETEKYFRSLANEDEFDLVDQTERNAMFKKKAELAYNNTFHITGTFLSIYFGSNYGVDGYCWSDLKKPNQQQTVLYTLERILYNWNCYDGQPGIPTGSGRMFDLTVSSPVVPTHLAEC